MQEPSKVQKTALAVTRWVGSPTSIIIHTILFIVSFFGVLLGYFPLDRMLLVLTTIVSLEAIYLSIFIQMTINYTTESIEGVAEDIEEIQEDVGELQEDVEDISEDVEEMAEEETEEEKLEAEHKKTIVDIQRDLRKLMSDIEKLQQPKQ